jgi:hypothetical protein
VIGLRAVTTASAGMGRALDEKASVGGTNLERYAGDQALGTRVLVPPSQAGRWHGGRCGSASEKGRASFRFEGRRIT